MTAVIPLETPLLFQTLEKRRRFFSCLGNDSF